MRYKMLKLKTLKIESFLKENECIIINNDNSFANSLEDNIENNIVILFSLIFYINNNNIKYI